MMDDMDDIENAWNALVEKQKESDKEPEHERDPNECPYCDGDLEDAWETSDGERVCYSCYWRLEVQHTEEDLDYLS